MTPITVSIIGFGRLAKELIPALYQAGINIHQICARSLDNEREVEEQFNCSVVQSIEALTDECQVIILAVPDGAIGAVSKSCSHLSALICHTSGMTPMHVIDSQRPGKFYPLNTFSGKGSWSDDTPIFIRATSAQDVNLLSSMATQISQQVIPYNDESDLQTIHLAAVVSHNFSNHLIARAEELLVEKNLPREIIHPLLRRLMANLAEHPAFQNQTGPAIRDDNTTIQRQRLALESQADLQAIYDRLTNSLQSHTFDISIFK